MASASSYIGIGLAALVVLGAAGTYAMCRAPDQEEDNPECPHSGVFKTDSVVVNGAVGLSEPITGIPEYHDCQRFISNTDSTRYQGLHAIFARSNLDIVVPDTATGLKQVFPAVGSIAAATIVSRDSAYPPLGLIKGVSCLYLRWDGAKWFATLKRNPDGNCPPTLEGEGDYDDFVVIHTMPETLFTGLTANHIPAVARWDYDRTNNIQYIGLRCGGYWCEVGPQGFVPSDVLAVPDGVDNLDRVKTLKIKGWHDRQRLAVLVEGTLRPGPMGVVYPHPAGEDRDELKDFRVDSPGLAAAYARVESNYDKLDLVGFPGENVFRVYAQKKWYCIINPWRFVGTLTKGGPGAPVTSKSVNYREHAADEGADFKIIATARWRWKASDETVWYGCGTGCCETCQQGTPGCD